MLRVLHTHGLLWRRYVLNLNDNMLSGTIPTLITTLTKLG